MKRLDADRRLVGSEVRLKRGEGLVAHISALHLSAVGQALEVNEDFLGSRLLILRRGKTVHSIAERVEVPGVLVGDLDPGLPLDVFRVVGETLLRVDNNGLVSSRVVDLSVQGRIRDLAIRAIWRVDFRTLVRAVSRALGQGGCLALGQAEERKLGARVVLAQESRREIER